MFQSGCEIVGPRPGGKLPATISSFVKSAFIQLPNEEAVGLEMLGELLLFALAAPQLQVNHPRGESPHNLPSIGPEMICGEDKGAAGVESEDGGRQGRTPHLQTAGSPPWASQDPRRCGPEVGGGTEEDAVKEHTHPRMPPGSLPPLPLPQDPFLPLSAPLTLTPWGI